MVTSNLEHSLNGHYPINRWLNSIRFVKIDGSIIPSVIFTHCHRLVPSEVHTYELCKITCSDPRYGAISSCISASLKCILPSPLCITLSQRSMLMTPLTRYHNNATMGKYHAFVRLTKPYKCYRKPCGAIEYVTWIIANDTDNIMWKSVLVPSNHYKQYIRKLCSYQHVLYYFLSFFILHFRKISFKICFKCL